MFKETITTTPTDVVKLEEENKKLRQRVEEYHNFLNGIYNDQQSYVQAKINALNKKYEVQGE